MAEPVTLETAKQHLRVFDTSEHSLIEIYIRAARQWVENFTGHILSPRSFVERFDAWGSYLTLYRRPVTAISSIAYDGVDEGDDQIPFTTFEYSTGQYPLLIYPEGTFPSLRTNGYITVTYTAGYATTAEVPEALVQAILLLVGHFYTIRAAASADSVEEVPLAVRSLCQSYRIPVMA